MGTTTAKDSTTRRESTSEWIAAHGKFNPNLILDGHYKSIDDADILDTTEWHDTDDHEDDPDSKPDDAELTPDEILAGLKSDDGTGWTDRVHDLPQTSFR